jgi:hypothetical protein
LRWDALVIPICEILLEEFISLHIGQKVHLYRHTIAPLIMPLRCISWTLEALPLKSSALALVPLLERLTEAFLIHLDIMSLLFSLVIDLSIGSVVARPLSLKATGLLVGRGVPRCIPVLVAIVLGRGLPLLGAGVLLNLLDVTRFNLSDMPDRLLRGILRRLPTFKLKISRVTLL